MLLQAAADGWNVPPSELTVSDGVITHAQSRTGCKRLQSYTAVVMWAGLSWYFAAQKPEDLVREVGNELRSIGDQRDVQHLAPV